MSSEIALYKGEGSDPCSTYALEKALNTHMDNRVHTIRPIKSFSELMWFPTEAKVLAVGGGHSPQIYEEIRTNSNLFTQILKENNISYLGSCAGAIVASGQTHLRVKGVGFQTRTSPFLGIFPQSMIAPLFSPEATSSFSHEVQSDKRISVNNFRILPIHTRTLEGNSEKNIVEMAHCFGPAFIDCQGIEGAEILATYDDASLPFLQFFKPSPPTYKWQLDSSISTDRVAESVFYKTPTAPPGLFTSAHFEFDSEVVASDLFKESFCDLTSKKQAELVAKMQESDASRSQIQRIYFEKVGITCKRL